MAELNNNNTTISSDEIISGDITGIIKDGVVCRSFSFGNVCPALGTGSVAGSVTCDANNSFTSREVTFNYSTDGGATASLTVFQKPLPVYLYDSVLQDVQNFEHIKKLNYLNTDPDTESGFKEIDLLEFSGLTIVWIDSITFDYNGFKWYYCFYCLAGKQGLYATGYVFDDNTPMNWSTRQINYDSFINSMVAGHYITLSETKDYIFICGIDDYNIMHIAKSDLCGYVDSKAIEADIITPGNMFIPTDVVDTVDSNYYMIRCADFGNIVCEYYYLFNMGTGNASMIQAVGNFNNLIGMSYLSDELPIYSYILNSKYPSNIQICIGNPVEYPTFSIFKTLELGDLTPSTLENNTTWHVITYFSEKGVTDDYTKVNYIVYNNKGVNIYGSDGSLKLYIQSLYNSPADVYVTDTHILIGLASEYPEVNKYNIIAINKYTFKVDTSLYSNTYETSTSFKIGQLKIRDF